MENTCSDREAGGKGKDYSAWMCNLVFALHSPSMLLIGRIRVNSLPHNPDF